ASVQRRGHLLADLRAGAHHAVPETREPEARPAWAGPDFEAVQGRRGGPDARLPEADGGRPGANVPADDVAHQGIIDRAGGVEPLRRGAIRRACAHTTTLWRGRPGGRGVAAGCRAGWIVGCVVVGRCGNYRTYFRMTGILVW